MSIEFTTSVVYLNIVHTRTNQHSHKHTNTTDTHTHMHTHAYSNFCHTQKIAAHNQESRQWVTQPSKVERATPPHIIYMNDQF